VTPWLYSVSALDRAINYFRYFVKAK
jgi:hypothetical protein